MRVPHICCRAFPEAFEDQTKYCPRSPSICPFAKNSYYLAAYRAPLWQSQAIGDTVARICADGVAKFRDLHPPNACAGCFETGHPAESTFSIRSIASWHLFARHVAAGKIPISITSSRAGTTLLRVAWLRGVFDQPPALGRSASNLSRIRQKPCVVRLNELERTWPV